VSREGHINEELHERAAHFPGQGSTCRGDLTEPDTKDTVKAVTEADVPAAQEHPETEGKDGSGTSTETAPQEKAETYSPKIVGFLCNWCTYAGADLAGVSRFQYPTDIKIIRVMCSTRIDPVILLETFKNGADGIFLGGCHLGDCHYITGNYHTIHKVELTKQLLDMAGMNRDRLKLEWISASEGQMFANKVKNFIDKIKTMGPSPISASFSEDEKDKKALTAATIARDTAMSFRLRSVVARIRKSVDEGNVYGDKVPVERFESLMKQLTTDEYIRSGILMALRTDPKTVEEVSDEIGIPTDIVFKNVARLWKKQMILPSGHKEASPTYLVAGGV
jgi:coenzyme F420-reducing hydrogenase delta subunit